MIRRHLLVLLSVLLAPSSWAQSESVAAQSITFTKEFPGSQPPYLSLTVRENGEALYRTDPEEKPVEFQLSAGSAQEIFSLARKLDFFRGAKLESERKVAQMGKKTLAFTNGTDRADVSFNHTENPDALALTSLFERLSQTQQHLQRLEYLLRFDRLGIVKELLLLEMNLDQGRLFEPTLLLPVLEKIQSNKALVNVAHARASQIIGKLQAAKH